MAERPIEVGRLHPVGNCWFTRRLVLSGTLYNLRETHQGRLFTVIKVSHQNSQTP